MILYASELSEFREDDVSQAIRKISFTSREEGETAFPDLGTVVRTVRSFAVQRASDEERLRRNAERNALEEDRRQHPENYIGYADVIKEYQRRKANGSGEQA